MLNMPERGYEDGITCCASSGPRALEVYARHLVSVANERLVVNSYLPSIVPLDGASGLSGRVVIEGRYPFVPECTMRIEVQEAANFAVDFRLPARASGLKIEINGQSHQATQSSPGFFRVQREWNPGDKVALTFDLPLRAHFQTASDGVRWVAFSWGPLTLAQSIVKQTDHPQNVLLVEQESEEGNRWLDREPAADKTPFSPSSAIEELDTSAPSGTTASDASEPSWRLKTPRKIILIPYFRAGANGGGVRTMFPTRRPL
jgi:DUF1680 family protein